MSDPVENPLPPPFPGAVEGRIDVSHVYYVTEKTLVTRYNINTSRQINSFNEDEKEISRQELFSKLYENIKEKIEQLRDGIQTNSLSDKEVKDQFKLILGIISWNSNT